MGLPQEFKEIVYQREDTAANKACICLANIIRLLKLKYIDVILHSFYSCEIFYTVCVVRNQQATEIIRQRSLTESGKDSSYFWEEMAGGTRGCLRWG